MWINYTIETNIDRRDGEAWQEFTRNKSFQSKSCCQQTTEKINFDLWDGTSVTESIFRQTNKPVLSRNKIMHICVLSRERIYFEKRKFRCNKSVSFV